MIETYEQRLARQIELEKEMIGLGQDRYYKQLTAGDESTLPPGQLLIRQTVGAVSSAIQQWTEAALAGKATKLAKTCRVLQELGYDETAILSLRICMAHLSSTETYQNVARCVAEAILQALEYKDFEEQNKLHLDFALKDMKAKASGTQRAKMMKHRRRKAGVADRDWSQEYKLNVGVRVVELIIESTGLFKKVKAARNGKNDTPCYFRATPELLEWLAKQHAACSLLKPYHLPLLIEPKQWTTPYDGGFITVPSTLLKTADKDHLEHLASDSVDLSRVYKAVNGLQNTAWRVNKKVLKVMMELWEIGGDRAGLPPKFGKELPHRPEDLETYTPEEMLIWKRSRREVFDYNHRITGKVSSIGSKLWVAQKYAEEQEFYYAYTLDWRGRAYPVGTGLQPQGDDSSKALLEFAEGKPLGEQGVPWLFVHIANCYGYDKAGYADRIQWVNEHSQEILDYAMEPLVHQGWAGAGDPFMFLAACFEYAAWYFNGDTYVSHLPIQVDGTCNGLQNYSAMLRDSVGGAAVNLVPQEKPADIYQTVADKGNLIIERDKLEGHEVAIQLGLNIITRNLAKRNTMTVPYAVTLFGMRDQLIDELSKMKEDGKLPEIGSLSISHVANYLAKVNSEAISSTVIAASVAMDWLKECVRTVSKYSPVVQWVSPIGLPIKQAYKTKDYTKVKVIINTKSVYFLINKEGESANSRKQVAGVAPNFIHSCDASHMMATINGALDADIQSFSFIHDSFGTHAANMTELSCILREQFVIQYGNRDVLGDFRYHMLQLVPEDAQVEIPPNCQMGDLNISKVLESQYFFA